MLKCAGTLTLIAEEDRTDRGRASYNGLCVDPATGSFQVQDGRLATRFNYEKSAVYYAFPLESGADGSSLFGNGDILAQPKADPKNLRKVGSFNARKLDQ